MRNCFMCAFLRDKTQLESYHIEIILPYSEASKKVIKSDIPFTFGYFGKDGRFIYVNADNFIDNRIKNRPGEIEQIWAYIGFHPLNTDIIPFEILCRDHACGNCIHPEYFCSTEALEKWMKKTHNWYDEGITKVELMTFSKDGVLVPSGQKRMSRAYEDNHPWEVDNPSEDMNC